MFKFVLSNIILAGLAIQESNAIGICSAVSDPHYRTFDGKVIQFQGECQYVLAKFEDENKPFTVLARNKKCGVSVTCVAEVTVKVKKLNIVIKRGKVVTVFGISKALPYNNRGVHIKNAGGKVEITTDVGLTVDYDGKYNVYIRVNDEYKGKMRGICGKYSGDPNDLEKLNNDITKDSQEFANSWKVGKSCPDAPPQENPCLTASASKVHLARDNCDKLNHNPFSTCHKDVKVETFIQDCEYDACGCTGHPLECVCEDYDDYATTCGYTGVNIVWRNLKKFKSCERFNQN